ncbi:LamG domain-containing protein, partial [bacterium]|nr:LamG domain-containing protein [bacterium]
FKQVPGVCGSALKLDGFTTAIVRAAAGAPELASGFTIEAWVALASYPWNTCPIVSQRSDEAAGYALSVGPRGELILALAVDGEWQTCASDDFAIPLRQWVHATGVYDPSAGLTIYLNGREAGALAVVGAMTPASDVDLRIGMGHAPCKPSHIHRDFGTRPSWFSLDGILDEVKIHARSLTASEVEDAFASQEPGPPDLPPRRMPSGPEGTGRFGATTCTLKYYEGWDAQWPVGPDADVVVRFDESPVRVVFWRGTRYSPAWVSENGLWMADQSVEAWNDEEGCFEHMQDRHCRYSHVRIIENSDARVVVHWRYAPVSARNNLWNVDTRTGWACWIDEYYTFYPDAMGVRKVTWDAGKVGHPRQFQESIPLCHPGQLQGDVIEADYATVANLRGETGTVSFVEAPEKRDDFPADLVIQMHNFKARNRPFILFEPGNEMGYLMDKKLSALAGPGSCCHWPVGQAICDGRTSQVADRATSFLGFPISKPPIHEGGGRMWVQTLYGMTDRPIDHLVHVAKSWTQAPELTGEGFASEGYDAGQRAYRLKADGGDLEMTLHGSAESPVYHPAFVIEGWGDVGATLTVDGTAVPQGPDFRVGHRHRLDGSDLVVWAKLEATAPVRLILRHDE